jgi:hypothetical protein
MRLVRLHGVALVAACLSFLGGCDDSNLSEINGTVTVEGTPVGAGSITFFPADGQGPTAGGAIKDGKYSVKVPPGKLKVSISAPKVVGKKKLYNTPDSPEGDITAETLPARYNAKSELEFEVKSGKNTKDWDLQKK